MDAPPEAAIGRGDDAFSAQDINESKNALSNELRVFHYVGRMANHAWQNEFVVGKRCVLPHRPLVFMADVSPSYAWALTANMTSTMSGKGISVACGPCRYPSTNGTESGLVANP